MEFVKALDQFHTCLSSDAVEVAVEAPLDVGETVTVVVLPPVAVDEPRGSRPNDGVKERADHSNHASMQSPFDRGAQLRREDTGGSCHITPRSARTGWRRDSGAEPHGVSPLRPHAPRV